MGEQHQLGMKALPGISLQVEGLELTKGTKAGRRLLTSSPKLPDGMPIPSQSRSQKLTGFMMKVKGEVCQPFPTIFY